VTSTIALLFKAMKRAFDLLLVAIICIILSPLILIVASVVRLKLGSPIFFRQRRPGYRGEPFLMTKFRTMNNQYDGSGNLLPDSQRMTWIGKLLRSTSLDELPELWNVLKGDMSLVGPRPLLMEYLPLYNERQARRHEVRPGITGWAQINGRNAISWEEKFELDVWYIDNQSLWLDLKILLLTLWKVVRRDGISAEGETFMPKFRGSGRGVEG
jgi:sugar transferase EpsL